jgi:ABC-type polysaccharide/polyol phosphate export permease
MHLSILYPYWLQRWVIWNPLMHAIDLFRLGVYGTYPSLPDMPYLLKATIAFICIGLIADRATLRRGSQ